jgi:peptidoglycan L-alanyl-D-glutamate endopeptidase CwlK
MSTPQERRSDLSALHPAVRKAVEATHRQIVAEGHPFEVFEAYRTPKRQAFLFAQGRTRPGEIVTKAGPWSSYHQYGLAADFVLKINGNWSWEDKGAKAKSWRRLHEIARENGLEPLDFERPHLQMAGLQVSQLRKGIYPPGGDAAWAENLRDAIIDWGEGAPPAPKIVDRPPLSDQAVDVASDGLASFTVEGEEMGMDETELNRAATPASVSSGASKVSHFSRVQPIIDKWEGGYVDHPEDPGGATNMGITLATLSRWRGRPAGKAEVKALTRAEAWQIMKTNYYEIVRGDDLPLPVCVAVHNAAVLHGPDRSGRFLQAAIARQGIGIDIDGAIGSETLQALARADKRRLLADFFSIQEQFLRGLRHFPTFGKGWMNRLEDIRRAANSMLAESPVVVVADAPQEVEEVVVPIERPEPVPTANVRELSLSNEDLRRLIQMLSKILFGGDGTVPAVFAERRAEIENAVKQINHVPNPAKPPLTTVNGALGETVGRMLDGRKTAIGVIGTVLTSAFTTAQGAGSLPAMLGPLAAVVPYLQPVLIGLAIWGGFGKFDKWFKRVPS